MKKGFGSGFFAGLLCTALAAALGVTALAASRSITVEDGVHITINGALFSPKNAAGKALPSFSHDDTVYVPAEALCGALGMTASYDAASRTFILTSPADSSSASPSAGASSFGYITADKAREIALSHAGVKAAEASFIKTELEWEHGRAEYEVEFYSGNTEYDYELDAITGNILSYDRDVENFQIPRQQNSASRITADQAKEAALRHAPAGSTVKKCKLEYDDGYAVYELELYHGRTEYECKIDAANGDVISWEIDD